MISPRSEGELAEAVASATAPLLVKGGGTRTIGDAQGEVLNTSGLSGVNLYEPAALTLVVQAGTPLAEIDALLAGERQRLGFEPPDLRGLLGRDGVSTIGGVAAANASGPRRLQGGAARDAMLGVRFIDGRGTAISSGGRVMKNVTGYDLVKLMAGSFGTLGVLTEVSLKVQSIPEAEVTLVLGGLDDAAGLAALRRALGSPYDVSGAARAGGRSYIRLEGMAGSVAYRAERLRAQCDAALVENAQSAAIWADIRDVSALQGRAGDIWRLSVLPTDAAGIAVEILAAIGGDTLRDAVYDWGGGLVWLALPAGADDAVRAAVNGRGAAIKLRGTGAAPFAPQSAQVSALTAALKAQFDPFGRFAAQSPMSQKVIP
jgi:glycolate oxidase FAD binding subunit